jgi:hypothetical protein
MSRVHPTVRSVGPDAIHLCLTVGERPHLFGCAWASYGEACLPGPSTCAARRIWARLGRARRLGGSGRPPRAVGDGPPREQG